MTYPEPHPIDHLAGARNARAGTRFESSDCVEAAETPTPKPNIACRIQTRLDHAIP